MKNSAITAKDFLKIVEWSDEDKCFIGSAVPLIGKCCHGEDESKVYKQLCQIVDEWMQIYKEDGRPLPKATAGKKYSGEFVVRVEPELHQALAIKAMQNHESLNSFVKEALMSAC